MRNIGKLTYVKPGVISNLTMYEQKIKETKEFQKWFKNSCIQDQFNEPLALRHGSHERFKAFKNNTKWIFFCEFKFACSCARDKFDRIYGGKKTDNHGIFLHECFLNIQNPYYCNREKFREINVAKIWEKWYDWIVAYKTRDNDWSYDQYIVKNPKQIRIINSYW